MTRCLIVVWGVLSILVIAGCAQPDAPHRACEEAGGFYSPNSEGETCFGIAGPEAGYPLGIKTVCEAQQSWPVRELVLDRERGVYRDRIVPGQFTQKRWTKVEGGYQCVEVAPES